MRKILDTTDRVRPLDTGVPTITSIIVRLILRNAMQMADDLARIADGQSLPIGHSVISFRSRAAAAELRRLHYAEDCRELVEITLGIGDSAGEVHHRILALESLIMAEASIAEDCLDDLGISADHPLRPRYVLSFLRLNRMEAKGLSRRDLKLERAECVVGILGEFVSILSESAKAGSKFHRWMERNPESCIAKTYRLYPQDVERICGQLAVGRNRGAAYELASLCLEVSISAIKAASTKYRTQIDLTNQS